MAKKRRTAPTKTTPTLTPDRAARLGRAVHLIAKGKKTRAQLLRQLKLDVRGFYRDLELLRQLGIEVELKERHYVLSKGLKSALAKLPFPDLRLTFAEVEQLSKGRTAAHKKLRERLAELGLS